MPTIYLISTNWKGQSSEITCKTKCEMCKVINKNDWALVFSKNVYHGIILKWTRS